MMRSTRPRTRAGISSSMAGLMAAYSLPMPAPVKNRPAKNQIGAHPSGRNLPVTGPRRTRTRQG